MYRTWKKIVALLLTIIVLSGSFSFPEKKGIVQAEIVQTETQKLTSEKESAFVGQDTKIEKNDSSEESMGDGIDSRKETDTGNKANSGKETDAVNRVNSGEETGAVDKVNLGKEAVTEEKVNYGKVTGLVDKGASQAEEDIGKLD